MKYGTIGTSWITETFIEAAGIAGGFELSAVYSRDERKGKAFAQKHNADNFFTDLKEMAASDKLDAVYIASPNALHYPQSRTFLQHGKHVLCEKPLCVTPAQVSDLQALADEKGLILLEGIKMMHLPQRQALHDAIKRVGLISSARFEYQQLSSKYNELLNGGLPNIFNPELATGSLMDLGIYCVYPALDLFGWPQNITSFARFLSSGADGFGNCIFNYDDKIVNLLYSKVGDGCCDSSIVGDKGTILIGSVSQLTNIRIKWNDGREEIISGDLSKAEAMSYEAANFLEYIKEPGKHKTEYGFACFMSLTASKAMEIIREQCGIRFCIY